MRAGLAGEDLAESIRPPNVARPAGLTEREVDVVRLIAGCLFLAVAARGLSNKHVAADPRR